MVGTSPFNVPAWIPPGGGQVAESLDGIFSFLPPSLPCLFLLFNYVIIVFIHLLVLFIINSFYLAVPLSIPPHFSL